MALENLDKSLADTVAKINEGAPGAIEKIVGAYTEVNIVSASVDLWLVPICMVVVAVVGVTALIADKHGGGKIIGSICGFLFIGLIFTLSATITQYKAPQASAIKQLTEKTLEKAKD